MARNIVLSVLAVVAVLAMAGFAAAEAPVMESGDAGIRNQSRGGEGVGDPAFSSPESTADPETYSLSGGPWQERGPVETGSIPAMQGSTAEPMCCSGENGPSVDASGNTLLRHGIDDGP